MEEESKVEDVLGSKFDELEILMMDLKISMQKMEKLNLKYDLEKIAQMYQNVKYAAKTTDNIELKERLLKRLDSLKSFEDLVSFFGPQKLYRQGSILGQGWRAGYSKQSLEVRGAKRHLLNKNKKQLHKRCRRQNKV